MISKCTDIGEHAGMVLSVSEKFNKFNQLQLDLSEIEADFSITELRSGIGNLKHRQTAETSANRIHCNQLETESNSDLELCSPMAVVKNFSLKELEKVTGNFSTIIGEGGFGVVYKGSMDDGRQVAVKKEKDPISHSTFHESRFLQQCDHQNIVQLVGIALLDSCLVTEYVPGGSLSELQSLTWQRRLSIVVQLASAMRHVHSLDIVHRDLKPDNVLLTLSGEAKLIDFGCACFLTEGNTGGVKDLGWGTVGYICPTFLTTLELCPSVDVYAFGLTVLQVLTGLNRVGEVHAILKGQAGDSLLGRVNSLDHLVAEFALRLDPTAGDWHQGVSRDFLKWAMACVQRDPAVRPSFEDLAPSLAQAYASLKSTVDASNVWADYFASMERRSERAKELLSHRGRRRTEGEAVWKRVRGAMSPSRAVSAIVSRTVKNGKPDALIDLAMAALFRVTEDIPRAIKLLWQSVEMQDDSMAKFLLGVCHSGGVGVDRIDKVKAMELYWAAAAPDRCPEAIVALGLCKIEGRGMQREVEEGKGMVARGLTHLGISSIVGQFLQGVCHYKGYVVSRNEREAAKCFQKSAHRGHWEAQYWLGRCYSWGIGVKEDDDKAMKWYLRAAQKGYVEAQFAVGWRLEVGAGVVQDTREAMVWYKKASDKGHERAMERRAELIALL